MKYKLILLSVLVSLNLFAQTFTNGVFVYDGITFDLNNVISLDTTKGDKNTNILYFSNGLVVRADTNSDLMINSFYQEVYDLDSSPHKSKFGASNLAATLTKGSVVFVYGGDETNSSSIISTPVADIQLSKGTFYFNVSDSKVLVFVLDGELTAHGPKNTELVVKKGSEFIAISNDVGIFHETSISAQTMKEDALEVLNSDVKDVVSLKDNVIFANIKGKVVGIVIN